MREITLPLGRGEHPFFRFRREPPSGEPSSATDERPGRAVDLVDRIARCDLDHNGTLVDFGTTAPLGISGWWSLAGDSSLVDAERDGETWTKVSARSLVVRFVTDTASPAFVSMRVRGVVSRSAVVSLDGKPLGTVALMRGQVRVVNTHTTVSPIAAGAHTVEIRFSGATRAQTEPLAGN